MYTLARCATELDDRPTRLRAYGTLQVAAGTPTHLFMFLGYYKGLWMSRNGSTGFNKLHKVCVCVCLSVCLYVCVCACEHASVLALQ